MSDDVSRETECFKTRVEQQIALKRAGLRKNVHHEGTLCSGCYAEPPLPRQRYGANCHRRAALESYHRRQAEFKRLKDLAEQNTSKGNDNGQSGSGCIGEAD